MARALTNAVKPFPKAILNSMPAVVSSTARMAPSSTWPNLGTNLTLSPTSNFAFGFINLRFYKVYGRRQPARHLRLFKTRPGVSQFTGVTSQ